MKKGGSALMQVTLVQTGKKDLIGAHTTILADDRPHHVPMSPAGVSPHLLANRRSLS